MKSTYRKILVAAALVAALGFQASAATTASIAISGSVPAIIEISVTSEAISQNLPLTQNISDLPIATVVERSNKKAGYTVVLESANAKASGLAGPTLTSGETQDVLPYSIKYNGNAVNFSGGSAVVSDASAKTDASGISKPVTVSYSGASYFLDESTYGDTLTFTIIAK
jgi:hypothetical protein